MTDKINAKQAVFTVLLYTAVLFSAVFSGGLLFPDIIPVTVILTVTAVISAPKADARSPVFPIALLCLSAVSLILTQGDFQTGFYETQKIAVFALAFTVGLSLFGKKRHLCDPLAVTAVLTAVFGILAVCGIFRFHEFTFRDGGILRLQSFVKYANTAACLLGTGYFAILKLYSDNPKKYLRYALSAVMLALFLTVSKACIPIFLAVGTYLIYRNKSLRGVFIFHAVLCGSCAIAVILTVRAGMLPLALLLSALGIYLGGMNLKYKDAYFRIWLALIAAALVSGISLVLLKPTIFPTFYKRLMYMRDSLGIFMDYPLFGAGTGSFRVLQYSYQSEMYGVSYVHSGLFQFLCENGIFFTLVFYGGAVRGLIKLRRKGETEMFSAAVLILTHSLVDFDLSFAAVLAVLGLILGFAFSSDKKTKSAKILCLFIVIPLIAVSVYQVGEYVLRRDFEASVLTGDYGEALEKAQRLEKLCPRDSSLKTNIAAFYEKTGAKDKVLPTLRSAVSLSPYDKDVFEGYMSYAHAEKDIEELIMHYINLAPKQEGTYVFAKAYINAAVKKGKITEAEAEKLYEITEARREKEGVIDRDALLSEITKND